MTGEAFRLWRVGEHNSFTYKGPKRTNATAKVGLEVELDVASGEPGAKAAMKILAELRYQPVAIVKKTRKSFRTVKDGFEVTITLDDCEGVGRFAEIEILAEEKDGERAESIVRAYAATLGLAAIEPRSYLHMTLESQK